KYIYDEEKRRWYGYGLCIRESEVGDVYFHAGKIDRNGTLFSAYVPRSKLHLIVLSNVYEKDYNPLLIFDYGVGLVVALSKVL
ncbi:MAG TPA: hypothetical protein PLD88_11825, partial [Candidatus Berkiella sp.]|nr:hypothetical protein [Candidatus Berkiella sp.]